MEAGAEIGLKVAKVTSRRTQSVLEEQDSEVELKLMVKIPDLSYGRQLPVSRSGRRYLPAGQRSSTRMEDMGVVCDVLNDFGFRSITLRSVVQIRNHLHYAVDVYYMTKRGNELEGVGRVANGETLNVSPQALYTPTGELFFIPFG